MYGPFPGRRNHLVPWYKHLWATRIDFIRLDEDLPDGIPFEETTSSLLDAVMLQNDHATAVSFTNSDTGKADYRLLTLSWTELIRTTPTSPYSERQHCVTRRQIQEALIMLARRPNVTWSCVEDLGAILSAAPSKVRREKAWIKAARTTAQFAAIFNEQYHDAGER